MKDIVFKRDYRAEEKPGPPPEPSVHLRNILQKIEDFYTSVPKKVNPKAKKKYDFLLKKCDEYARKFHGTLEGRVDFTHYQADIDLITDGFEFWFEDRIFLISLGLCANTINFLVNEDGTIRLHIMILYFDDLHDPKDLENMVENDPDYQAILEEDKLEAEKPANGNETK